MYVHRHTSYSIQPSFSHPSSYIAGKPKKDFPGNSAEDPFLPHGSLGMSHMDVAQGVKYEQSIPISQQPKLQWRIEECDAPMLA
jgi:hypothetical protein